MEINVKYYGFVNLFKVFFLHPCPIYYINSLKDIVAGSLFKLIREFPKQWIALILYDDNIVINCCDKTLG